MENTGYPDEVNAKPDRNPWKEDGTYATLSVCDKLLPLQIHPFHAPGDKN